MYFCRSKLAFVQFHNFLDIFRGGLIAMPPHHSVFKPFFCIVIYRPPSQELPVFTSATTQCIYTTRCNVVKMITYNIWITPASQQVSRPSGWRSPFLISVFDSPPPKESTKIAAWFFRLFLRLHNWIQILMLSSQISLEPSVCRSNTVLYELFLRRTTIAGWVLGKSSLS